MKPTPDLERVFPLSSGSFERPVLRPPQLASAPRFTLPVATGNHAFLRAWAARRAAVRAAAYAARASIEAGDGVAIGAGK
jgi:hypothetical protein